MCQVCVMISIIKYFLRFSKRTVDYQIDCRLFLQQKILNKDSLQKQPSRGVLRKRCSINMQQIYRRTPMPKCDFNKVPLELYSNRTSAWVFSCKFAAYFQNIFFEEHLRVAASVTHPLTTKSRASGVQTPSNFGFN